MELITSDDDRGVPGTLRWQDERKDVENSQQTLILGVIGRCQERRVQIRVVAQLSVKNGR
jgi:hypothetical protein